MPYAARQGGGKGTIQTGLEAVKDGCPNAGLGVVGGKGLRKPLIPCPISAVDARKAPASPNGHGPAGRHSVARREATTPGCRAASAGQRKKREPCSSEKIDAHARGKPKPQSRAKKKYSAAKEHGKESRKGRTKFLSLGKAKCKRADSPGDSEGKELTGESVSEGEEGRR